MRRLVLGITLILAIGLTACGRGGGQDFWTGQGRPEADQHDGPEDNRVFYAFPDSTAIDAITYYPTDGTLEIRFVPGGEAKFCDVPESTVDGLIAATSAGGYYSDHIAGRYGGARWTTLGWICHPSAGILLPQPTTVRCADGTISHNPGRQGSCSWHGGYAQP